MKKSKKLRKLLEIDKILVVPGAPNALTAILIEKTGFEAVYMSGAGTSYSMLGRPDIGLLTMSEMVMNARYIARATNIPVIADADTGYGNAINVMRTVEEFISAGVAAVHIEDQVSPKRCGHIEGKELISVEEMVGKIRAADRVRRETDPDFILIARTDARTAIGGSLDEVIKRAKKYIEAGADIIFPESPLSVDEMRILTKSIEAPLIANMVVGGKTPYLSANELQEIGYKIVIFPNSCLKYAMRAISDLLKELKVKGTDKDFIPKMYSLKETFDLLGYEEIKRFENEFLPKNR
ncbi:carboxyvinyl-carboxyphosphonate phosphorylmutase [Archaeoglobales archaeon]|nr:MAG: carboxyvinyl-carboxyphosphonate phosphorylmutase [Archaeoglobales archaeon]